MSGILERLLHAARTYTLLDYACLKIALASFGILLGAYFADFFLRYAIWLWTFFIVSYLAIVYRTLAALKRN